MVNVDLPDPTKVLLSLFNFFTSLIFLRKRQSYNGHSQVRAKGAPKLGDKMGKRDDVLKSMEPKKLNEKTALRRLCDKIFLGINFAAALVLLQKFSQVLKRAKRTRQV